MAVSVAGIVGSSMFIAATLVATADDRWYVSHECAPEPDPQCVPRIERVEKVNQQNNQALRVLVASSLVAITVAAWSVVRRDPSSSPSRTRRA